MTTTNNETQPSSVKIITPKEEQEVVPKDSSFYNPKHESEKKKRK